MTLGRPGAAARPPAGARVTCDRVVCDASHGVAVAVALSRRVYRAFVQDTRWALDVWARPHEVRAKNGLRGTDGTFFLSLFIQMK